MLCIVLCVVGRFVAGVIVLLLWRLSWVVEFCGAHLLGVFVIGTLACLAYKGFLYGWVLGLIGCRLLQCAGGVLCCWPGRLSWGLGRFCCSKLWV